MSDLIERLEAFQDEIGNMRQAVESTLAAAVEAAGKKQ